MTIFAQRLLASPVKFSLGSPTQPQSDHRVSLSAHDTVHFGMLSAKLPHHRPGGFGKPVGGGGKDPRKPPGDNNRQPADALDIPSSPSGSEYSDVVEGYGFRIKHGKNKGTWITTSQPCSDHGSDTPELRKWKQGYRKRQADTARARRQYQRKKSTQPSKPRAVSPPNPNLQYGFDATVKGVRMRIATSQPCSPHASDSDNTQHVKSAYRRNITEKLRSKKRNRVENLSPEERQQKINRNKTHREAQTTEKLMHQHPIMDPFRYTSDAGEAAPLLADALKTKGFTSIRYDDEAVRRGMERYQRSKASGSQASSSLQGAATGMENLALGAVPTNPAEAQQAREEAENLRALALEQLRRANLLEGRADNWQSMQPAAGGEIPATSTPQKSSKNSKTSKPPRSTRRPTHHASHSSKTSRVSAPAQMDPNQPSWQPVSIDEHGQYVYDWVYPSQTTSGAPTQTNTDYGYAFNSSSNPYSTTFTSDDGNPPGTEIRGVLGWMKKGNNGQYRFSRPFTPPPE